MNTQSQLGASKAARFGYRVGQFTLRGFRRWGQLRRALVVRAITAYGGPGRFGALVALSAIELGCIILLVLINTWLLALALMIAGALIASWFNLSSEALTQHNDPGPDHLGADFYLGDYDDNGHYIGHCKSSTRFPND